jgi:hypothetical protein
MKLFWILNVTFHALNNSFTFIRFRISEADSRIESRKSSAFGYAFHSKKKSPYSHRYHSLVVLTKDNFPLNDNDDNTVQPISKVTTIEEEQMIFSFKKRDDSIYNGCDQRKPMNISDVDTLLYFYQKFYEMYQKHELLKKLQSTIINNHEKLKIIDEYNHLLDTKYKHNPLYKGFDEFM